MTDEKSAAESVEPTAQDNTLTGTPPQAPPPEQLFPDLDEPEPVHEGEIQDEADVIRYENVEPPTNFHRIVSLLRTGPLALVLRFVDQIMRNLTGSPVWRLSRITEHVYVGGQHYPSGWQRMQDEGIQAVVNMREERFSDVEKGIQGEHHLHLNTLDNTPPTLENLEIAAQFIAEQVNQDHKVYVHCGVGVGRAPSAAAAYFIYEGLSARDAIRKIRRVRPFVHLTGRQRKQLDVFENFMRSKHGTPTS